MTQDNLAVLTTDQIQSALSRIASMADTLAYLCRLSINEDKDGHLRTAAAHMADQIGMIADRCNTGIPTQSADDWIFTRNRDATTLLS